MNQVALIMGSDSDLAIAEKAAEILNKLEIKFEMRVMSAHRTPDKVIEFAKNAKAKFWRDYSYSGQGCSLGRIYRGEYARACDRRSRKISRLGRA